MSEEEYRVELPLAVTRSGAMVLGVCGFLTVYFRGAHTPNVRNGVIACLKLYTDRYGSNLRFSTDFPNKRWIAFDSEAVQRITQHIVSGAPDDSWQFRVHGGQENESPSYFKIQGLGFRDWQDAQGDYLSFLRIQIPPDWIGRGDLASFFRFACDQLKPSQGWGGLSFALGEDLNDRRRLEPVIYQLAHRGPLLEVEDPVFDQAELGKGVRGANWLTAIGEPWLHTLGGIEGLRRELGPPFTVFAYPNGAMIQAGDVYGAVDPSIREANPRELTADQRQQATVPPHYRRLARVLRPVRLKEFPAMHSCQYGRPCFDQDATNAWLNRFD